MFDKINIDGEDHELWASSEDRDTFNLDKLFVIGITEKGPVRGTVSMGPTGVFFSVEDYILHLDLTNLQSMCSVFAALVDALSTTVVNHMTETMEELESVIRELNKETDDDVERVEASEA